MSDDLGLTEEERNRVQHNLAWGTMYGITRIIVKLQAQVDRAKFYQDHDEDRTDDPDFVCDACEDIGDGFDPRHHWEDADWLAGAEKKLKDD